jgi:hypothetical protein
MVLKHTVAYFASHSDYKKCYFRMSGDMSPVKVTSLIYTQDDWKRALFWHSLNIVKNISENRNTFNVNLFLPHLLYYRSLNAYLNTCYFVLETFKYCRIPLNPMGDCVFWGVPIWTTDGFKASHWSIHSISNTWIYIGTNQCGQYLIETLLREAPSHSQSEDIAWSASPDLSIIHSML